jgi:AcrR family transcriptional regulator
LKKKKFALTTKNLYFAENLTLLDKKFMGVLERKQREREQRRATILSTARSIALKEGWPAVSMRKIADAIEYTPPTIYEHFENKDLLLYELQREGFHLLGQWFSEAKASANFPAEQLLKISLAQWRFANEHPELYQVMFGLQGALCQHGTNTPPTELRTAGEFVRSTLKALAPAVVRHKGGLTDIFLHWWSLVHGYIALSMQGAIPEPPEQMERYFTSAVQRFIQSLQ